MADTPFSDIPRGASQKRGITPVRAGLLFVVVVGVFAFFAVTKANPFADPYELYAVFENANELKPRSPVRIAGVEVGKVKEVEALGADKARVKMVIEDKGLPIKEDAQLKIRQRIFLEGNYFVDLQPGTPEAPERKDGSTVPFTQTASPVQFGQVLTALQYDTREDLKTFLREYAKGTAGKGARGFNMAVRYWEEAYRNTAMSTRATLGLEPGDLGRVLRGQGKVFGALSRDENALKLLVVSLNRLAAAFASQEANLRATIPALRDVLKVGRPALASLNRAFPSMRAFAREALPAARSSSSTLDVQIPFITQARRLVSNEELGGLVRDLRPTVPALARLNARQTLTLRQTRLLASCQSNVLVPFSKTPIPDPDFPGNSNQPFYKQSPRALVGLSGESRIADANSPMFRVLAGGGPTTLVSTGETGDRIFAQLDYPLDGVRPARPEKRPVFRPGIPCETQEPPNLNAERGEPDLTTTPQPKVGAKAMKRRAEAREALDEVRTHLRSVLQGLPSIDPLEFSDRGLELEAKRLGLKRNDDGTYRRVGRTDR
jgi:phospholipid/cholesterol/gamma-HCH transport system substrate-binding protein